MKNDEEIFNEAVEEPLEEIAEETVVEITEEPVEENAENPVENKPRKKRRVWKILAIIFGSLFLLILIAALVLFLIVNSKLNKISRVEITGNLNLSEEEVYAEEPTVDAPDSVVEINQAQLEFQEAQKIQIAQSDGVENILLIGSDRRDSTENGRSDTIILLTLNYNTKKIHQTSFMRAMYVCIPRPDGNRWGMLNAAYSWGGPNLLIDTIELNFRVHIDHYVVINFSAFEKAVDLVGGIDLTLSDEEARYVYSYKVDKAPEGKVTLNGMQALRYARVRYFDNDFKRTSRQRKVIELLIAKAKNSDITTLMKMADEILPMVSTDIQDNSIIWNYIFKTFPIMGNATKGRMLPVENESGETYTGIIYVGGREMYKVNFAANIKALHEYINS